MLKNGFGRKWEEWMETETTKQVFVVGATVHPSFRLSSLFKGLVYVVVEPTVTHKRTHVGNICWSSKHEVRDPQKSKEDCRSHQRLPLHI